MNVETAQRERCNLESAQLVNALTIAFVGCLVPQSPWTDNLYLTISTLAFASLELGESNFPEGFVAASNSHKPLGMEIALVTEKVAAAHANALVNGAEEIRAPQSKPWGQTVSYLRCPAGVLVELCSPMG